VSEQEFEPVMSFWIDTDGYADRDREMFVCGVEFQMIYAIVLANRDWNQCIHTKNESRVRMMCGKLGVQVKMRRECDTWTHCCISASLSNFQREIRQVQLQALERQMAEIDKLQSQLAAAQSRVAELESQNNNLCLLIVRLARRVRVFEKGSDVATKALDYLSRNGLMPSVLRDEKQ